MDPMTVISLSLCIRIEWCNWRNLLFNSFDKIFNTACKGTLNVSFNIFNSLVITVILSRLLPRDQDGLEKFKYFLYAQNQNFVKLTLDFSRSVYKSTHLKTWFNWLWLFNLEVVWNRIIAGEIFVIQFVKWFQCEQ